jgi:hypothetical protein
LIEKPPLWKLDRPGRSGAHPYSASGQWNSNCGAKKSQCLCDPYVFASVVSAALQTIATQT